MVVPYTSWEYYSWWWMIHDRPWCKQITEPDSQVAEEISDLLKCFVTTKNVKVVKHS